MISLPKAIFESLTWKQRLCYGLEEVAIGYQERISLWSVFHLNHSHSISVCGSSMNSRLSRPLLCPGLTSMLQLFFTSILKPGRHAPLPCSGMSHARPALLTLAVKPLLVFLLRTVTSVLSRPPFLTPLVLRRRAYV